MPDVKMGVVTTTAPRENGEAKITHDAIRWADGLITYGSVTVRPRTLVGDSFRPNKQTLSGFCSGGQHELCPGLVAQDRGTGRVLVAICACSCDHQAGQFKCTKCGTRRQLLDHPGVAEGMDRIDPRTGACVDREGCATIVANRVRNSPLRKAGIMPRTDSTAEGTTERAPRTPRVKEGVCQHCGVKTAGGKFAPGHDANLKSELIATYSNHEASDTVRTDALAEAVARGWLRYEAAHDNRLLMKGIKDDADKQKVSDRWDGLLTAARAKVDKETAEKLIERRTKARIAA
jgi:hypothetical protein